MRCCGEKKVLLAQSVAGQFPTGTPSVDVSSELELEDKAVGTFARGKNQMLCI